MNTSSSILPKTGYSRLIALFLSAGVLLAANGLVVTLISLRGNYLGFSDWFIGILGSAYYAGFFVGCILTPLLIRRVGHIRVFSAFVSIAAISVFLLPFSEQHFVWMGLRFTNGVAFCGTAMAIESWLNYLASNHDRARIFSVYRIVDLGAVTGAQFLLPIFGVEGFEIFIVIGIMFCFCLVPMCLSREGNPESPAKTKFSLTTLWKISPVAAVGSLTVGLTNGAFRTVGPIYAQEIGLGIDQVALFISLWVTAGALFQYPLGLASDRVDRRYVLIFATTGAGLSCLFLSIVGGVTFVYTFGFLFGGFALPLYSLSAAQAYDNAHESQFVEVAASLTLFFTLGAVIGPLMASLIMDKIGANWFFVYTGFLHLIFILFVVYRISQRRAKDASERSRFVWLLRNSPLLHKLARGSRK